MPKVDLSVEIAGVKFPTCIYNASGPRCGAAEAMHKIAISKAGAVLSKSATLESQTGNPTPRIFHGDIASFNSEGLPNKGIDYYISNETVEQVFANATSEKPYIVSLSGKTMTDNLEMLKRISLAQAPIAAVELNLACPNIIGKPIIAYDVAQVQDCLERIRTSQLQLPPLGVKLAPYLDMVLLEDIAKVLLSYKDVVQYVVTINTVGNTLPMDGVAAETPFIRANGGLAGMSGAAVTPIALANVWKLKQILDSDIPIVGVGGIRTGQDAYNMILAGASACQVGTTHWVEGPECFDRIVSELTTILQSKGHDNIKSVVGALKPWSSTNRPVKPSVQKDSGGSSTSDNGGVYQVLSIVLAVMVAMLLADKFRVMG